MKKSIVFTFLYALLFMCACGTDDEELMTGPGGGTGGEGGNSGGSGAGSVPQLLIGEWAYEQQNAQGNGFIKYVEFGEDGSYYVGLTFLDTEESYGIEGQYYVENTVHLYIKLNGESQYSPYEIVELTQNVLKIRNADEESGGAINLETYTRYNDEDDGGGGEEEEPGTGTEVNLSEPIIGAVEKYSIAVKGTILASEGTVFEQRGICYGTEPHPTVNDARTLAVNSDVVDATLTGLYEGTVYYIRLFAVVDGKAYYGDELSVTTEGEAVDQIDLTFIKAGTSFVEIADKYPNGFDRTNSGICYGTSPQPKITDQYISYGDQINGNWRIENLAPGTVYYIRPYRIEGARVVYFDESEIEVETIGASVDISCTVQHWAYGFSGAYSTSWHCKNITPTLHYSNLPEGLYECKITGGRYNTMDDYAETLYIEGGSGELEFPEIYILYRSHPLTVTVTDMETQFQWILWGGFNANSETKVVTSYGDDFGWRR